MVAAPNFTNDMAEVLANVFIAAGFKESLLALQLQIATRFIFSIRDKLYSCQIFSLAIT
jgi:hypothetical protein